MTNQEINERIAAITGFHDKVGLKKRGLWYRPEACGYTNCECEAGRFTLEEAKKREYLLYEPVTIHRFKTPNYAESLDACKEFEGAIGKQALEYYAENLAVAVWGSAIGNTMSYLGVAQLITATPLQRCEAFLRLKGQWDEN